MTLPQFKRSVDTSNLVSVSTVESTNVRNNIVQKGKGYFFEAVTKTNEIVSLDGGSWDEIFKKLPDVLKKVNYAEYSI
jgi:hypothetical protein